MADSIRRKQALTLMNTLALPAEARYFLRAETAADLETGLRFAIDNALPLLLLGGGSNVVMTGDYPGICMQVATSGIEARNVDGETVEVIAQAGEDWHGFVDYCLCRGWYGLENLALIPGTVGAAPIQNIGAYGVEVKDFIQRVVVTDLRTLESSQIEASDCEFGYRDSIFKRRFKDRYLITAVTFRLRRKPWLKRQYGVLDRALEGLDPATPRDLFDAVVKIRQSKLPDPKRLPNAGSFFKNPVVSHEQYAGLQTQFADMPAYPEPRGVKLAAAWLIDRAGWKGYRRGRVGVHDQQALVLVNHGGGEGQELLELAENIKQDVFQRYGINLEVEPRIY